MALLLSGGWGKGGGALGRGQNNLIRSGSESDDEAIIVAQEGIILSAKSL